MSYNAVVARYATLSRIARIAEDQWGLITRRQAEGTGISQATLQRLAKTGILDRVAHGVYRLTGAPLPDYLDLRAAWLQLAPEVPAWERTPEQGVVSHRSAAVLYGLGHLPADRHEFTLPERRQSRRPDVRLHHRTIRPDEWIVLHGMPVTRPARIAADLLGDKEDPRLSRRLLPMPCGLSTTTQARSRTPLRRTLPVSGSGEGMAWRSLAGSSARLATRKHPGG